MNPTNRGPRAYLSGMNQADVIALVKNNAPQHYRKYGSFRFEQVDSEQSVITSISGERETKNRAAAGDYILTGPQGERYVLKPETFQKRYKIVGAGMAEAIGECWGMIYHGEPFSFLASWGEQIICRDGDWLVSPDPQFSQVYRVEADVFSTTYRPAD